MALEASTLYTESIFGTIPFIKLIGLIILLSFGTYIASVNLFPLFNDLLTSSPVMWRIRKEIKRIVTLLLLYLCIAIIYAFSGTAILSFIVETGNVENFILSSMIVGIAVASITRILASSGLKSIVKALYYQIIFTVAVIVLFWQGPLELAHQRKIFNPIHLVFSKMLEEKYMLLLAFLLIFVYFITESMIQIIRLSRLKILKPLKNEDN